MPMADFADGKSVVFIGTGLKKTLGFQLQNNSGFSAETPWFLPLPPVFPWFSHGFTVVFLDKKPGRGEEMDRLLPLGG